MSPDNALIVFTSLGFASVFLALVIGMNGTNSADLVSSIAGMTPAARKQARFAHLDYLTQVADDAIHARQSGKRLKLESERF